MTRYVVCYNAGVVGTDVAVLTDDNVYNSAKEAVDAYTSDGWDWYYQYNDEDDNYLEAELDIWAEEYDPEKHDAIL